MSGYAERKIDIDVLWYGEFNDEDNRDVINRIYLSEGKARERYRSHLRLIRRNKTQKKMIIFDKREQTKVTIVRDTGTIIALKSYFGDEFIDRDGNLVLETGQQIKDVREKLKLNRNGKENSKNVY